MPYIIHRLHIHTIHDLPSQAARQLRDRCHSLLRSLRENEPRLDNKKMIDAINAVHEYEFLAFYHKIN